MDHQIDLVVMQSTPFCNIACKYCYLPDRSSTQKMSLTTLRNVFSRVFESGWVRDRFTVVWHAGEPMTLGPAYYDAAFSLIESLRPRDIAIQHSFQTNGTLINQEWCDFIRRTGLKIGVSIDGPQPIHDKFRVLRDGKGSFQRTMQGINLLRQNGIDFSVIAVLTKCSLLAPDQLYDFFAGHNIERLSFNVEEIEGVNRTSSITPDDAYDLYWNFLNYFWERLLAERKRISQREFEEAFACIVRPDASSMLNSQTTPFRMLNVDVRGNFSTFSPEFLGQSDPRYGNFCFGNLNNVTLESALSNPIYLKLNEDIQRGVDKCRAECQYFSVCGGGAPVNKLNENGSLATSETLFCRLTKMVPIDLALALLENDVNLRADDQRENADAPGMMRAPDPAQLAGSEA